MQGIEHALRRLERIWVLIAALMLFAIMVVATIDVALRYLFNSPLGWSYDLISLYLMGGVFFFSLADTLGQNGHVAVDLLHNGLTPRTRHLLEIPGYALAVIVIGCIAWLAAAKTIASFRADEVIAGRIDWPTWISSAFVALGFALMFARIVFRLVGHTASVLSRRSEIALPPIAGREAD